MGHLPEIFGKPVVHILPDGQKLMGDTLLEQQEEQAQEKKEPEPPEQPEPAE